MSRLIVVTALSLCCSAALATPRQPAVNPHAAAVGAFQDRLNAYLDVHRKAAGTLAPLDDTRDATRLAGRQRELGLAIQRARAGAKRGDVFGEIGPTIVEIVRRDWTRRNAADRKALLAERFEELPPTHRAAKPNMIYPTEVPLATFPAALLETLPRLPEGLEYRFYGRQLILRDTDANLIVDVLDGVLTT